MMKTINFFYKKTFAHSLIGLLLLQEVVFSENQTSSPFIRAAYLESWSQFDEPIDGRQVFTPELIDVELLTDLYYAFAIFGFITTDRDPENPRLTGNFSVEPLYKNETKVFFPKLNQLKTLSKGKLRLFLSIGGANFNNPDDPHNIGTFTYKLFSQMVSSKKNREEFINSAIHFAHKYHFDGIDIDWEFPAVSNKGGSDKDYDNFLVFLKEASSSFHHATPQLLLSIAISPVPPPNSPRIYQESPALYYQWVAKAARYVDRIVVMAYNYHTSFDSEKITGVNSPLNSDTNPESQLFISKNLDSLIESGVPAKKILLGIPIFGWSYGQVKNLKEGDYGPGKPFGQPGSPGPFLKQKGFLAYFEILELLSQKKIFQKNDLLTNTMYGYNAETKEWVSFDTPETTRLKIREAKKRGLGGVIFWAINLDDYQSKPPFPNIRQAL